MMAWVPVIMVPHLGTAGPSRAPGAGKGPPPIVAGMDETPVFVIDACRTPIGRHGGALAEIRPDDLAADAIRGLVGRSADLDPARIDDVWFGNANGAGEENRNVARMATLLAGLPTSVPGATVNRLCGSGLEAVACASREVAIGDASLVVAGGVESMSRAPWVVMKPARPYDRSDLTMHSTTLGWRLVNPRMPAEWAVSLGEAAELAADRYGIDREHQDAWAVASHAKALAAWEAGEMDDEVVAVTGSDLVRDEGIRPGTTRESLARLRPSFRPDGTVTAGNASQLSDGAAALLLGNEAVAGTLCPTAVGPHRLPGRPCRRAPVVGHGPGRGGRQGAQGGGHRLGRPGGRRAQRGLRRPGPDLPLAVARAGPGPGQPGWRGHRPGPPARVLGRPGAGHVGLAAGPPRRGLGVGHLVHRRGSGHRRGHRGGANRRMTDGVGTARPDRWPTQQALVLTGLRRGTARPALVDDRVTWSGVELRQHVAQQARALTGLGLGPGSRIGLLGANSADFAAAQLACVVAGATYSGLHQLAPAEELRASLGTLRADALIFDPSSTGDTVSVIAADAVALGCQLLSLGPHPDAVNLLARAADEPGELAPVRVGDADPCSISWSGGTTGRSKGVLRSQRAIACMTMLMLAEWDWPRELRFVAVGPLSHATGSMVAAILVRGGTIYVRPRFDPDDLLETIATERATATFLVPTMIYRLLDHPATATADLSSLELVIYGASPISPTRLNEALHRLGPVLMQLYGQVEAPNTITALKVTDHVPDDLERLASAAGPGRPGGGPTRPGRSGGGARSGR